MPCSPRGCNCALAGPAVQGGSGQSGDPYIIETGIPTFCTSLTRPASPFIGQVIYETDTDRTWMHDGSDWRIQHDPVTTSRSVFTPASNTDATTSGTPTLWLTNPDVTVPPWATAVDAIWVWNGQYMTTDAAVYYLLPRLDGNAPVTMGRAAAAGGLNERLSTIAQPTWTGLTPGDVLTPTTLAQRSSGSGQLRADPNATYVEILFHWKES